MIVESLYDSIKQGKSGLNMGLSTGMPKVDSLTYGIQRKWLTVVAGDSGSGKSSYVLYTKVFKAFQQYQEDDCNTSFYLPDQVTNPAAHTTFSEGLQSSFQFLSNLPCNS